MGPIGHHFGRTTWVTASDPLTHDDEITDRRSLHNFVLDIKKLFTHSVSPIIIRGGLIVIYDFLLSRPRALSSSIMPRLLLFPPWVGWNDVMAMSHRLWVMWVMASLVNCVMGHMGHGPWKLTHFHLWYWLLNIDWHPKLNPSNRGFRPHTNPDLLVWKQAGYLVFGYPGTRVAFPAQDVAAVKCFDWIRKSLTNQSKTFCKLYLNFAVEQK